MLAHHQNHIALGSNIDLVLVCDPKHTDVGELFRQLWIYIFEFEKRFSRFLPDSELSQFNRAAGLRQPISPAFHELLSTTQKMSDLTEGLYNPFILPALQRAGYLHSMVAAHSGDDVDDYSRRSVAPADQLEIGESWATIPYGTALDFGGIGKGYAGDALADLADGFGELQGYWFSLGGDIVSGGVDETNQPWVIDIEDTSKRDSIAARVTAPARARCAVATSSILRRKGVKNGKAWHHLIDPRTNLPARSDTETASISAPTALLADMLASCAVIVGSEQALPYIQPRGAEGALLQTKQHKKIFWGNIRHYRQTVSPSKP